MSKLKGTPQMIPWEQLPNHDWVSLIYGTDCKGKRYNISLCVYNYNSLSVAELNDMTLQIIVNGLNSFYEFLDSNNVNYIRRISVANLPHIYLVPINGNTQNVQYSWLPFSASRRQDEYLQGRWL